MKFQVASQDLRNAIPQVSRCSSRTNTMPIMAGILIKAHNNTLELQANDLTMSASMKVPCQVQAEGDTVVSTRMLESIVKTTSDLPVTFETDTAYATITFGTTEYKVPTLPAADFPSFPTVDATQSIELPVKLLQEMAHKVVAVTSHDQSRLILTGVFLNCQENRVRFVATDTFRLALAEATIETSSLKEPLTVIIPGEALKIVLAMVTDEDKVMIGVNQSEIIFSFGTTTFVSRKIEGNYPNYQQLIPESCTTSITSEIEDFAQAVSRVAIVSDLSTAIRFKIDSAEQEITLTCNNNEMGSATEQMKPHIDGADCTILLNNTYLKDCLNVISHDKELLVELNGALKPAVFKTSGDISYLYILMPVNDL